jgi:hypothetical protein
MRAIGAIRPRMALYPRSGSAGIGPARASLSERPMRVFLILLVLIFVGWRIHVGVASHTSADALQGRHPGFLEARLSFRGLPEVVMLEERPDRRACPAPGAAPLLPAFCRGGHVCDVRSAVCHERITARYRDLLARQPADTHYVHLRYDDRDRAIRYAVLVPRGDDATLARQLCQTVSGDEETDLGPVVNCM